jgi:hypothetical protein
MQAGDADINNYNNKYITFCWWLINGPEDRRWAPNVRVPGEQNV